MSLPLKTLCIDADPISRQRLTTLLQRREELLVTSTCAHPAAAHRAVIVEQPDVIMLEQCLPGMDGLTLLPKLFEASRERPLTVFVSRDPSAASAAFDLDVVDFVTKPYVSDRLDRAVDRVLRRAAADRRLQTPRSNDRLCCRVEGRIRYVPHDVVESVAASGKGVEVGLAHGPSARVSEPLSKLEQRLTEPSFIRVSRFAIVNLDHLIDMEDHRNDTATMAMRSGRTIHVSRRGRRQLRQRLERAPMSSVERCA